MDNPQDIKIVLNEEAESLIPEGYKEFLAKSKGSSDSSTSATTSNKIDTESKVKNIEDLYQGFIDEINKISAKSKYEQKKIQRDESLTDEEEQAELFKLAKSISSSAAQVGTKIYEELMNQYDDYMQKALEDPDIYSQEIVDAYEKALDGIEDKVYNFENNMHEIRQKFVQQLDDANAEIEDYIATRNLYNDWDKYGDSQIQAIKREMDNTREAYESEYLTHKEFVDRMLELEKDSYSVGKEALIQSMEDLISEREEELNIQKESLNFQQSKYSSLNTLLQSYYDVINNVKEAQYDINKELKASQTMYEYLDDESRQLLFNQEDYNKLSSELNLISAKANKLQREYINAVQSAKEEELDEITDSYQRQYDLMMKSYEIAKADLEVAKKKKQLNNVLNERNVNMFINGEWRWVANTQDVINAQNELADAKFAQEQANDSMSQTLNLNKLQSAQDGIATEINYLESDLEKIRDKWEQMQNQLNGQSQSLAQVLADMATSDAPQLQNILSKIGAPLANLYEMLTGEKLDIPTAEYHTMANTGVEFDANTDYMQKILDSSSIADAIVYNTLRNAKIKETGSSETQLTDKEVADLWKEKHKKDDIIPLKFFQYASGTNNAKRGKSVLGEDDYEVLIDSSKHLIPITQPTFANLNGGEIVFNKEQMENLRNLWDISQFKNVTAGLSPNLSILPKTQQSIITTDNSVTINGMTVDGGSKNGQELLNALRRYVSINT